MEIVLWNGARKALPAFLLGVAEKVDRHARALSRNRTFLANGYAERKGSGLLHP